AGARHPGHRRAVRRTAGRAPGCGGAARVPRPGGLRPRAGGGRRLRRPSEASGGGLRMSPSSKVVDLAAAAELVRDGDHVAIGGCLYSRTPWAMLMELLRAGRTGLTLSRSLMCYEAELFLARGAATALVSSWVGIGLPWGTSKVFRRH